MNLVDAVQARRASRPGQAAFRVLFVPLLLALSVSAWIGHGEIDAALRRGRWGVDFTTAALLVSLALIWLSEQLYPANPAWNYNVTSDPVRGLNRLGRDLFYLTIVTLLNGALTGLIAARLPGVLARVGLAPRLLWPTALPFAAKVLLAFLVVELFSYGYHRAAHKLELLWRFHSTHHVITELTGAKALRTHPLDNALFYLPRTVPLLLLGAGASELVAATYFGCILGILSHANLELSDRGLGWFINFPRFHAVHHSSQLEESNSNFGCHTVLWDHVFRTFRASKGEAPIGVAPVGARTLWQELVWPLYRSVAVERPASVEPSALE